MLLKDQSWIYRYIKSVRMFFIRKFYNLKHVSNTFYLGGKSIISKDIIAGRYTYIGPNCVIYPKVSIGDYTMLANDVAIIGGDHNYNLPGMPIIFSGRDNLKPTIIGKDVWVGAYVKIIAGVSIGDGSIIAMGSVVTKDVAPFSIYGGVPAVKIKERFQNSEDIIKHEEMLKKTFKDCGFIFNLLP